MAFSGDKGQWRGIKTGKELLYGMGGAVWSFAALSMEMQLMGAGRMLVSGS